MSLNLHPLKVGDTVVEVDMFYNQMERPQANESLGDVAIWHHKPFA